MLEIGDRDPALSLSSKSTKKQRKGKASCFFLQLASLLGGEASLGEEPSTLSSGESNMFLD
jgi:hypothetical protein